MNLLSDEPVGVAFSLQAFLTLLGAWIGYRGWLPGEEIALLIPLVLMGTAGGLWLWARSRVASKGTIERTGQSLESVAHVANNPNLMLEVTGTGDGGPRT